MSLHPDTFGYLLPTDEQKTQMNEAREAAKVYSDAIESLMPEGPDKTHVLRMHRQNATWVNIGITRQPDGAPRT